MKALLACAFAWMSFVSSAVMANDIPIQEGDELSIALAEFERTLHSPDASPEVRLKAIWGAAEMYRQLGKYRAALATLDQASGIADAIPGGLPITQLKRAGALAGLGRTEEAKALLDSLATNVNFDLRSQYVLHSSRAYVAYEQYDESAASEYQQAAAVAARAREPALQVEALINGLRAQLADKNLAGVEARFEHIEDLLDDLSQSDGASALYLSLGQLYRQAVNEFDFELHFRGNAFRAYRTALERARSETARGWAYGYLGSLYEDEGREREALQLTRKALFAAQSAGAVEQAYRWEWQIGRLLMALNRLDESERAYSRASYLLNEIRPDLVLGSRNTFNRFIAPVYTEYADVMLTSTAAMNAGEPKQAALGRVRDLLETLKQAEVEDYFANECVVRNKLRRGTAIHDSHAAVIYPIFLDARTEVLLEVDGNIQQLTTPVGRNQITQTIRRLRVALERETAGDAFLDHAQTLYDWLIRPGMETLKQHQIETLVIVPEGALRTIPLAALHSGEKFLIEQFAIATTPAIKMTQELEPRETENLLVGGLTESRFGFPGLPNVGKEIETISRIYPAQTIQDETFQLQTVSAELETGDFSVAHFATHGEFDKDYRKSYLLTYDARLTLNGLQKSLEQRGADPLDLLVLSACKTAAGDDRAALGLAGVAVQSGARSALASLWSISDAATAELISTFYQRLKESNQSKAQSLRDAQRQLLASDRYRHPSYWAPYLLIGNWL